MYDSSDASCATVHFPRRADTTEGEWRPVRQPWHIAGRVPGGVVPVIDNEHFNYASTGRTNPATSAAACAAALISGCGATCHHDRPGVWTDVEYHSQPNAATLQRSLRLVSEYLPHNVANWRRVRTGQDGFPFPELVAQHWSFAGHDGYVHERDGTWGCSRAYAAIRGHRYAMVIIGVRGHVELRTKHGGPYSIIDLAQGSVIVAAGRESITLTGDDTSFLVTSNVAEQEF